MPITATDRIRVARAIEAMYRMPWARPRLLIEGVAEESGCGRRQLERAFASLELSAAKELRAIRCELAAACLVEPSWRGTTECEIARALGLADDRALRRVIAERWRTSPSSIRMAASLYRHLVAMQRRAEHSRKGWGETGDDFSSSYGKQLFATIRRIVGNAPIEVRRLVEGEIVFPLPRQAVRQRRELAQQRVARYEELLLESAELAA